MSPLTIFKINLLSGNMDVLGRLLMDPHLPNPPDFCPVEVSFCNDDIFTKTFPLSRFEASGDSFLVKLNRLITHNDCHDRSIMVDLRASTISLRHPKKHFERLCEEATTRSWLETTIKYGWDVFMVVGLHRVSSSAELSSIDCIDSGPVFAVQICHVEYNWSFDAEIDKELRPQWQVFPIQCRRDSESTKTYPCSCCNHEPDTVQPFLTDVSVAEFREITKKYYAEIRTTTQKSVKEIEICGFGDFVFVEPAGVIEYAGDP